MELRCLNWFEGRGEERFVYLKARTRENETVFVRFAHYFYYVVEDSVLRALAPRPARARELGEFELADVDEPLSSTHELPARARRRARLWLLAEPRRRELPQALLGEFLNITWFFLQHELEPDGCYRVDPGALTPLSAHVYHCEDARAAFATRVPLFEVTRTYLFFDIECQFDKKFPSVFSNPVSHASFCCVDRAGVESCFSLVNSDLLPAGELAPEEVLRDAREFSLARSVTFCPEVVLLQLAKRLLERSFDFVVTFNGNNFDIRYLANRLELLTQTSILFRLPDRRETVKLCVYERHLASHRGAGGMAHTSYHINSINGTIFFDLYTFVQKAERLDSYRLDSISKHAFHCHARVLDAGGGECTLVAGADSDAADRVALFREVLQTGNYVTLDATHVCAILGKRFLERGCALRVACAEAYAHGQLVHMAFGKDDVDLREMYRHYGRGVALEMERYCRHDACLCKYLWRYYGVPSKIDAAAATYLLPQCLALEYKASTLIKGPLLRLLLRERLVYVRAEARARYLYVGGRVLPPKQKVFDQNVIVFDYNSLYPNVCLFANLSPETLLGVVLNSNRLDAEICLQEVRRRYPAPDFIHVVCEPRTPDLYNEVAVYDRRRRGVIPKLLETFMEQRRRYKALLGSAGSALERALYDSMQYVYKIVANSVYGLMGFANSSLYSYASAKCCTTIGRVMIGYLESVVDGAALRGGVLTLAAAPHNPLFDTPHTDPRVAAELALGTDLDLRFRSVYGDTDSIFLEVNLRDVATTVAVARFLERVLNERVLFENFRVEFEAVFQNLILQSKKKYSTLKFGAGYRAGDAPERVNKGTSETRRDVSRFHKVMIQRYKALLVELLARGEQDSRQICVEVLRRLETDLFAEFAARALPLDMFLLSRLHHRNYKAPDNPNLELVARYNRENREPIELGERYAYAYVCDAMLPWQVHVTNVRSYERIVDRAYAVSPRERIFYEVYFRRLATEVVNLLDNRTLSIEFFSRLFGTRPLFST
ncbi:DNA-dependent DNA polymerase [Equine molluscum contagiosum-like virus]|nr:DNA-dependent DNA polymerase [Equine molluscum contagiosum-like virus]